MKVTNDEHNKALTEYEKKSSDAILKHNSKSNDWEYAKRIEAHLQENANNTNNTKLQSGGLMDLVNKKGKMDIYDQIARNEKRKQNNRKVNKKGMVNDSEERKLLQNENEVGDDQEVSVTITYHDGQEDEAEIENDNDNDDDTGIQRTLTKFGQKANTGHWIERIYSFMVESLSSADLITDCIILQSLYTEKIQWLTIVTVLLMLAPYLVSYAVLDRLAFEVLQRRELNKVGKGGKNQRKSISAKKKIKKWLFNIGAFTMMTPLNLIYFILLDVFFQIHILLSGIIFMITCFKYDITDLVDDYVFQGIFQMDLMNVLGYGRLRTLTQLIFESIPALVLQIWIISTHRENTYGIGVYGLVLSIIVAICHLICEMLIVYVDSHACETSLLKYAIECLRARLEFVPFAETFKTKRDKQIEDIQTKVENQTYQSMKEKEEAKLECYQEINFEKLEASICKKKISN